MEKIKIIHYVCILVHGYDMRIYGHLKFILRNKLKKFNILICQESILKNNMDCIISYIDIWKLSVYINKIKIKEYA